MRENQNFPEVLESDWLKKNSYVSGSKDLDLYFQVLI